MSFDGGLWAGRAGWAGWAGSEDRTWFRYLGIDRQILNEEKNPIRIVHLLRSGVCIILHYSLLSHPD